jgi:NADPH2:quinone reductase
MQGLTAQHLAALADADDTVLVHSAAGGVGLLLTQLLATAGTTVIARVSGVRLLRFAQAGDDTAARG